MFEVYAAAMNDVGGVSYANRADADADADVAVTEKETDKTDETYIARLEHAQGVAANSTKAIVDDSFTLTYNTSSGAISGSSNSSLKSEAILGHSSCRKHGSSNIQCHINEQGFQNLCV